MVKLANEFKRRETIYLDVQTSEKSAVGDQNKMTSVVVDITGVHVKQAFDKIKVPCVVRDETKNTISDIKNIRGLFVRPLFDNLYLIGNDSDIINPDKTLNIENAKCVSDNNDALLRCLRDGCFEGVKYFFGKEKTMSLKTALMYARDYGHKDILDYLESLNKPVENISGAGVGNVSGNVDTKIEAKEKRILQSDGYIFFLS